MSVGQATKKPTMLGFYAVAGKGGTLTMGRTVLSYSISDNPKRSSDGWRKRTRSKRPEL